MDGYEVARRLRSARNGTISLVALTGYGQADDRRKAIEAGFDVHLTKPVEIERLEEIVALLGSNIGNVAADEAAALLGLIRAALRRSNCVLLGADLVKPECELIARLRRSARSHSGVQ